jgi:hypothetical protein
LLDEFGHPILQLRSGPFSVDTLVHVEQFLGLDGEDSITAPVAVRDGSHGRQTEDAAKHPKSGPGQKLSRRPISRTSASPLKADSERTSHHFVWCHHRKSFDFSITSSVHSSLREHLGSISNACEVLVWPQYGTDRIFGRLFLG